MKIAVYSAGESPQVWLNAIRQHLPQAQAWAWEPGAPQADYALVWKPPQQLFDEQGAGLKAIFNMGAVVNGDVAKGAKAVPAQVAGVFGVAVKNYYLSLCHVFISFLDMFWRL